MKAVATITVGAILSSCGGGGGGSSSDAETTVRPSSLSSVSMVTPIGTFTFVADPGSPEAELTGQTEVGTVRYTTSPTGLGTQLTSLDPTLGAPLSVVSPIAADGFRYIYTASSDASATVSITQSGSSLFADPGIPLTGGNNGIGHAYFGALPGAPETFTMTINFNTDGSVITGAIVELNDADSTAVNVHDRTRVGGGGLLVVDGVLQADEVNFFPFAVPNAIQSTAPLATMNATFNVAAPSTVSGVSTVAGALPVNFSNAINPNPITFQEAMIGGSNMIFTDATTPANSFQLTFVRTNVASTGVSTAVVPEEGTTAFTNATGTGAAGGTYTYEINPDNAQATIEITSGALPPNNIPEEGSIIVTYTGVASRNPITGAVISNASGTYTSTGTGNTGTFLLVQP